MAKIIKNNLARQNFKKFRRVKNFLVICLPAKVFRRKILVGLIIFLLVTLWIFSGWPRIWQNPPIPPEVEETEAATERQSPDGLLQQDNLNGALSDIQDDPDNNPDENWLTYIDNNVNTVTRVSFPNPTGDPTVGADLQEFKIWVRKQPGTGTPTVRIELYENNVSKAVVMAATDVTSSSGQLFSATWNANLLGTADGSQVELYIYGTAVGGKPSARCTVEVGAVEWNVDYTPPTTRYWVGGEGNWEDTEHWAYTTGGDPGASVPTLINRVYFDGNFIKGGTGTTAKVNEPATCRSLDCTGFSRILELSATLTVAEDLIFHLGMEFIPSTNKVILSGSAGSFLLISANESFYDLQINDSDTTWTLLGYALDVDNDLTITTGTLDTGSDYGITVGGSWSNSGTFAANSGTVTFDADSSQTLTGTMTGTSAFYNLYFNNLSGDWTLNNDLKVTNVLTINAGELDAGEDMTIELSGGGKPFVKTGTFTCSTSTVEYTASADTDITAAHYNHLKLIDPPSEVPKAQAQTQDSILNEEFIKQNLFYEQDGQLKLNNSKVERKDDVWIMDKARYKAEFKDNVKTQDPIKYSYKEEEISFTPLGLYWSNSKEEKTTIKESVNDVQAKPISTGKGIIYEDAYALGIDIEARTENTVFQKLIKIKSKESLGEIPADAKYLEIPFELNTNTDFIINGKKWDGKDILIKEAVKLGKHIEIKEPIAYHSSSMSDKREREIENETLIEYELKEREGKICLTKRIPVEWLLKSPYPVYTDLIIVLEDVETFESEDTWYISIAALDSSRFVIAFMDYDDGSKGKVIAGSVSGTTITITPDTAETKTFESGSTYETSIAALDNSHFVIAFTDYDDGSKGKVIAGSVDAARNITLGVVKTFESGATNNISIARLNSSHFVIAFRDNGDGDKGKVIAGSVSETDITIVLEDVETFASGNAHANSIAALDSSHFVISFADWDDGSKGKVIAGSVSETTITITPDTAETKTFASGNTYNISITALDISHFVIAFRDWDDANQGKVIAGTIFETDITIVLEDVETFESGYAQYISIARLDNSRFVIAFSEYSDNEKGKVIAGSVSGTTITITPDTAETKTFASGATTKISMAALDSSRFVIAFRDNDDSPGKGKVIAGMEKPPIYTLLNGIFDIDGDLTIGKGTTEMEVTANIHDPIIYLEGDITITTNSTFTAPPSASFTVGGSWSNSGTFAANSGTVTFDADSSQTLTGTMTGTSAFYNLYFNNASGVWTLGDTLDVDNDLTITNGTLDTGSDQGITVGGSWSNSGTFTANSGTVIFDGAGASNITGATTFNNFTCITADKTLKFKEGQTFTITNTLTLTGGGADDEVVLTHQDGDSSRFSLSVDANQTVSYVSVSHSNVVGAASIGITADNSVNGGDNDDGDPVPHWVFGAPPAPSLSFSIEAPADLEIGFGTLSITQIRYPTDDEQGTTEIPGDNLPIKLTASTNAGSGLTITIRSTGGGGSAGLYNSATSEIIDAKASTLVAGTEEGYGVYAKNEASLTIDEGFDHDSTDDVAIDVTAKRIVYTSAEVSSGTVDILPLAAIASTTPAGTYSDTLTLICTGNF